MYAYYNTRRRRTASLNGLVGRRRRIHISKPGARQEQKFGKKKNKKGKYGGPSSKCVSEVATSFAPKTRANDGVGAGDGNNFYF